MSDNFDPLYEWLGIPPKDQPPNHYRLLGIELFEANANVIERAADRQMGHIRTFQSGKYSRASQEILNKLSAAKLCLLDARQKAAYDTRLRKAIEDGKRKIAPVAEGSTSLKVAPAARLVSPKLSSEAAKRLAQRRRVQLFVGTAISSVILLVMVIVAVAFYATRQTTSNPDPVRPPIADASSTADAKQQPHPFDANANRVASAESQGMVPRAEPPATDRPSSSAEATTQSDKKMASEPAKSEPSQPSSPQSPSLDTSTSNPSISPVPLPSPQTATAPIVETPTISPSIAPSAQFAKEKQPAPNAEELAAEVVRVQESLESQIDANDTPVKKIPFAASLISTAREEANSTTKYALLLKARDIAIDAGDTWAAMRAIDELSDSYEFDAWGLYDEALGKLTPKSRTESAKRQIAEVALALSLEAAADDKFDAAERFLVHARRSKALSRNAAERAKSLARQRSLAQQAIEARRQLEQTPDNSAANLTQGLYLCFLKEEWSLGLASLAKGNDAELAEIARRELTPPESAEGRLDLAAAWIAWAKNRSEPTFAPWARAQFWLARALPSLSDASKSRAEDLIHETIVAQNQSGDLRRTWSGSEASPGHVMTLNGHSGQVIALAVTRSCRRLVSVAQDGTVRTWDLVSGLEVSKIPIRVGNVFAAALHPDEEKLILATTNQKLVTLELLSGSELASFTVPSAVRDLVLSADGRRLVFLPTEPANGIFTCMADGSSQTPFTAKQPIRRVDISRSGTVVAIAEESNEVELIDLRRRTRNGVLTSTGVVLTDVRISPNEEFVTGCFADNLTTWNVETKKELFRVSIPTGARRVGFTADSRRAVVSSMTNQLATVDIQASKAIANFTVTNAKVSPCRSLAIFPDGRGAATAGSDGSISVWRLPD